MTSLPRLYRANLDAIPDQSMTDKVLVLDLDETLVSVHEADGSYQQLGIDRMPNLRRNVFTMTLDDPVDVKGLGTYEGFWGMRRPHLREFLIFAFSYFKAVIVWSAGADRYVEAIVNTIFSDVAQPHLVYARSQCVTDARARNHKPLRKMISNEPGLDQYMSLDNAFMIDDKISTYIDNPDNGIQIPAYDPALRINSLLSDDIALLQLKQWLLRPEVMSAPDVRLLDKRTIFQTPLTQPSAGVCVISPDTGLLMCGSEQRNSKESEGDPGSILRAALQSLRA